jgi:pyruvate,orthophosphate dikinase
MNDDATLTGVLQLVRLKGRVTVAMLGTSIGMGQTSAEEALQQLVALGAVVDTNGQFRISPAGRSLLTQRIASERESVDATSLRATYQEFHALNVEFKTLITDWQLRAGVANDHSNQAYDRAVLDRLAALDARWQPLLSRIVGLAPRLAHYPPRFTSALSKVQTGDSTFLARPVVDSYHTVWFELHEDLIGLLGLSRDSEAAAGRAE